MWWKRTICAIIGHNYPKASGFLKIRHTRVCIRCEHRDTVGSKY